MREETWGLGRYRENATPFSGKDKNDSGLEAQVNITLPFDQAKRNIREITDTMRRVSVGREIRIKAASIYGNAHRWAIQLPLPSDLKAAVCLRAKIGFDTSTSIVTHVPPISQTLPNS